MPNYFAYFVLFCWPLVCVWLYSTKSPGKATVMALLGAHLLLPARLAVDLPLIPPFDKQSLPNIGALIGCLLFARNARRRLLPRSSIMDFWSAVYLLSPFVTAALNSDVVWVGGKLLAGMSYYDALSASIQLVFYSMIPFWLGRAFVNDYDAIKFLLRALVIGGLCYSLAILVEIRLSPQLHTWIYGYFPHMFIQQMRYGGFRPVVFLGHGLLVAFFAMTATSAAVALFRMNVRILPIPTAGLAAYLSVIVLLCKTVAAVLYTTIMWIFVGLLGPRPQLVLALGIASFVMVYPALRVSEAFPTDAIVSAAAVVDRERADSLQFRFDQEREMIARARLRPWFGWGSWGRYRTYSKDEGEDASVTDSRWFITFGQYGMIGFIAEFSLILWPLLLLRRVVRRDSTKKEKIAVMAIALMLTVSTLDCLVNDSLPPLAWLMTGSLVGFVEQHRKMKRLQKHMDGRQQSEQGIEERRRAMRPRKPLALEHKS